MGWDFLDAALGIAGSVLVARWAIGLIKETGKTLLDAEMDHPVVQEIREAVGGLPVPAQITDLHVWKVARGQFSCILALEAEQALTADQVRRALAVHAEIAHVSVEINLPEYAEHVPRETA